MIIVPPSSRKLFIAILLPILAVSCATEKSGRDSTADAWARVPGILKNIVPPQFPWREFVVTKYGALGDGTSDSSEAFQKAISECSSAGGGSVIVPSGTFLTSPI